jgi:hypothetical protein
MRIHSNADCIKIRILQTFFLLHAQSDHRQQQHEHFIGLVASLPRCLVDSSIPRKSSWSLLFSSTPACLPTIHVFPLATIAQEYIAECEPAQSGITHLWCHPSPRRFILPTTNAHYSSFPYLACASASISALCK